MAAFQKGHKKTGGRVKGVPNKASSDLKELLDRNLPDEELWKLWQKRLYSKDEHIAIKALEMAMHYRFGKPMTIVAGPEEQPPIKIDISAIPKFRVPVQCVRPSHAAYGADSRRLVRNTSRPDPVTDDVGDEEEAKEGRV